MNYINGSGPGMSMAPCPDDCTDCASERCLGLLVEKLESRGLEFRLVTYSGNGVQGSHRDAVNATNPAAPKRGMIHVEKNGLVTWEYSGTLDTAGISKILDDVTNILRTTGLRFRHGWPS